MASTQTAVLLQAHDSDIRKSLRVDTAAAIPTPAEGEALVRVVCRSVNPIDAISLEGQYPRFTKETPTVPGTQGVGVVQSSSSGRFKKGDRVVGVPFPTELINRGSWQQYVAIPEDNPIAVPAELDDESASQLDVNTMTVRGFFDELRIPAGEWLLQTAAGSPLGQQVIQLAKHYGIKTINVVRREAQRQELLQLGADEVIVATDKTGEDIVKRVGEISGGKGAYGTVDAVGGDLTLQLLAATRNSGRLLVYGVLSGYTISASIMDLLFFDKSIHGFCKPIWDKKVEPERYKAMQQEMIDLLVRRIITPPHGRSFPLEQAAEAVIESQKAARGGKIYLKG